MNRGQWPAATTILEGIVQRLNTEHESEIYPALDGVSAAELVQVEYMMVFDAIKRLYRAGRPLDHDTVMSEVQASEPGGGFGFACGVFEQFWEKRSELNVGTTELENAVELLIEIGTRKRGAT